MGKMRRRGLVIVLLILYIACVFAGPVEVLAEGEELIVSPHGILMEASTGTILFEKDADVRVRPASITKIMTLLLIFEELEKGTLQMEDMVTTSAFAKSMGGSQVFLEEGEQQNVETMIKCIVIASGNDASVAMAEHIAGSEGEFVARMNERAAQLGMENTHFNDCSGLTEAEEHYTTARDVANMSRELVSRFPKILEYSSIWMEDMTHVTKQGSSTFGLTNTNKLVRSYDGCMGLKTGSTSLAKYCVSAVAVRNDVTLISVVMTAPDYKVRFKDAAAMLNSGFASCQIYEDSSPEALEPLPIKGSVKSEAACEYAGVFRYVDTEGRSMEGITGEAKLPEKVNAPVKQGDKAGEMVYYLDGEEIGRMDIIYSESVEKSGFWDYFSVCMKKAAGFGEKATGA